MGGVTSIAASEDDADVFTASTVEGIVIVLP